MRRFSTEAQAQAAMPKAKQEMAFGCFDKFTIERDTLSNDNLFLIAMYSATNTFCGYY